MTATENFWVVLGDIHDESANIHRITELPGARGVIISGDFTNGGHWSRVENILQEVRAINPVVYGQIGNMDHHDVQQQLENLGLSIHARGIMLDEELGIMGLGYSNQTPFGTPSETSEEKLASWLEQGYAQISQARYKVLISHPPPANTVADQVSKGQHVGSTAVRQFILDKKIDLCIAGHIHEGVGQDNVQGTTVINPGTLSDGGYVILYKNQEGPRAELKFL